MCKQACRAAAAGKTRRRPKPAADRPTVEDSGGAEPAESRLVLEVNGGQKSDLSPMTTFFFFCCSSLEYGLLG